MAKTQFVVISDFDGTIPVRDVCNEIARSFAPEKFEKLHEAYRQNEISLKQMQSELWTNFPCSQDQFLSKAKEAGQFRAGFFSFLNFCHQENIDFHIASCGIRQYIEELLEHWLPIDPKDRVRSIAANSVQFDDQRIRSIHFPHASSDSSDPLDKGEHARDFKKNNCHVIALGNGTSDRKFIGVADTLFATDGLARYLSLIHI